MGFDGKSTADDVVRDLDLSGRVMIVTGANTGIGYETARALASKGARVILGCRNAETGEAAAEKIRFTQPGSEAEFRKLDLASLQSVRDFVKSLRVEGVDAVVCNAGVYLPKFEQTEDGFEKTVGVCHFGHFLLVTMLRPKLRAADNARVVMVSSESHRSPRTLDFDRFPLTPDNYRDLISYGQAKLCNVLFANELTRRWADDGVTSNSLHPGTLIGTDIGRSSALAKIAITLAKPFAKSLNQGAATNVYCAVSPDLDGVGGKYYRDCAEFRMSRGARDEDAARRLWDLSLEWTARV